MIIDCKIKPPRHSSQKIFQPEQNKFLCESLHMWQPESVTQRSMELLLKEMDSVEIAKALVHGRIGGPDLMGLSADEVRDIISAYPERMVGAFAIDPSKPDSAIAFIETETARGVMKAVVIEPGLLPCNWYINDRRIYPVYDHCARHGVVTIVLSGGEAGPDISYSNPVLLDQVARDFPNLKLVASCGGYPWVQQILHVAFRRNNIYICPDIFLFSMPGWQDYVQAANFYLQDRFLFASGYPLLPVEGCVRAFRNLPFKPEILPKLLYKNAADLLKLQ